jgi:hypothetical protein
LVKVKINKDGEPVSMVVNRKNSKGNFLTAYEDTSVNIVTAEHGHVPMVIIFDRDEN